MADFRELIDLAAERLGGSVLYATDDFFAEKENLLKPAKAIWKEHEYTDRGKWMDGWESRRKRVPGHDFAIVRLGAPGVLRGVVVDTAFFRGNFPSHCSIEGTVARFESPHEELSNWVELLPKSELQGDSENLFEIDSNLAVTHLRFHIYPDGGVARLRVHGEVVPDWRRSGGLANEQDLAAVEHGGQVLTCSDMFFGPKHNLIMPGRAFNMSDGWETKRRRGPGHDWVIVQLACEANVRRIELDTSHFKGNFPDTASIDAKRDDGEWQELLPRTKLLADTRHVFVAASGGASSTAELRPSGSVTHLRLNVYPDGGVARMRVHALATERGRGDVAARRLDTLTPERATEELRSCCASTEWVAQMVAARPFGSWSALSGKADELWSRLGKDAWLEAFAAHPRIGERKADRFSAGEQSGTASASAETMDALAQANRDYESKFGHVYLVCATGRSGDEMLALARRRMTNSADEELRVAAEEQRKITRLRLLKLV